MYECLPISVMQCNDNHIKFFNLLCILICSFLLFLLLRMLFIQFNRSLINIMNLHVLMFV